MAYTTIDDPFKFFNTVLYTGNGSARTITGVGFQPDWVWLKGRSDTSNNFVYDSVRGDNLFLQTNKNNADGNATTSSAGGIGSQASDGFTIVAGTSNTDNVNTSGSTYVAWNWLAGGSASSNSNGSITSSVSANTTAGFSIATYTGTGSNATVGHGLGTAPAWVLVKERGAAGESWNNFHQSLGAGKTIMLNLTNAEQSSSTMWNNTVPTSSVFSVGADAGSNGSSKTYVAYCFAEKKGYSKFGSYTGNGSTNGTFVYTGFRPAFVITKRTDGAVDWYMFDNKRQNSFNVVNGMLRPSANSVELDDSSVYVDFLSNGFKWKGNNAGDNTSGGTYIFMAFAEAPFVTAGTKAPGTAR